MRSLRSIAWPASATARTSWRWRFAGSWIKGRRSRSGAPGGPISSRRSRMCSVGVSTTTRARPSIASWRRRSRTRSARNSWLRRPARRRHPQQGDRAVRVWLVSTHGGIVPRERFFMNWYGTEQVEGFEYHVLAIGLAVALVLDGAGAWSLDALIAGHLGTALS